MELPGPLTLLAEAERDIDEAARWYGRKPLAWASCSLTI